MCAVPSTPLLLLFALGLLVFTAVFGLPASNRFLLVLNNFAHAPIFGALAIVNYLILRRHILLPSRSMYALTFIVTVAFGFGIELIQLAIGRDGELRDVATDALGAGAGLALVALTQPIVKPFPATILVLSMTIAAWPVVETALGYLERYRQAPALLELSSRFDWLFIWTHGFRTTLSELPASWKRPDDPTSLGIQIERDSWRVLSLTEPMPDWRHFDRLMVDMTNPESEPLRLTLRVHDRTHNNEHHDRFNRSIGIPADSRVLVEIPLADVAAAPSYRRMDLSKVAGVMIFATGQPELAGRRFYLTRIWLEPKATGNLGNQPPP